MESGVIYIYTHIIWGSDLRKTPLFYVHLPVIPFVNIVEERIQSGGTWIGLIAMSWIWVIVSINRVPDSGTMVRYDPETEAPDFMPVSSLITVSISWVISLSAGGLKSFFIDSHVRVSRSLGHITMHKFSLPRFILSTT